jgi:hypothetical protein
MPLFNPFVGGSGSIGSGLFTNITANTTTTSLTFVDLLSTSITISNQSRILISFTGSMSNASNNQTHFFRVLVNGATITGGGTGTRIASGAGNPQVIALHAQTAALAAGTYTIALQWRTTGGTVQCRPIAAPDAEHASMVVQEILP